MTTLYVTAKDLSGRDIGSVIRVMLTNSDTKVDEILTGELREVSNDGVYVTLRLGPKYNERRKLVTLASQDHPICLSPPVSAVPDIRQLRKTSGSPFS